MAVQPADWSVVIVGRWNRAILTPTGIARRVFKLEDPKQILVAVPLDGVSPYQVRHPTHDIIAMTDETRLLVHVLKMDYDTLGHAMIAGKNALKSLPETPVVAAGFNINFEASEVESDLASLLTADVDSMLAGLDQTAVVRSVTRSYEYGRGQLNITVSGTPDKFTLACNFHRGSTAVEDLVDWLETPVDEAKRKVQQVLELLKVNLEEPPHGEDGD